ncbi:uncharacterized protein LOC114943300 isoform X2 [Nylanderia fulva]|uniref:uncharacterized protein LOC114943300 isoform X2 n=1 Tax=Nylanderia fulva TaxID=613905 RepID=UPI0010FBB181|nr:uncharacterized protein LOC114943300 isoform X2 [Nylanderia fulva]
MTLDELLEQVRTAFDCRLSRVERQRKFEARTWGPGDVSLRNQARIHHYDSAGALLEVFRRVTIQPEARDRIKLGAGDKSKSAGKHFNKFSLRVAKQPDEQRATDIKCYNCNRVGYISRECIRPKRERGLCYECGEKGHVYNDCPKKKNKQQITNIYDNPAAETNFRRNVMFEIKGSNFRQMLCLDTLLDTGSPVSFVKERFIGNANIDPINEFDHRYCGINNSKLTIVGKITARITLGNDCAEDVTVLIVPENTMITSAVLGRDVLRRFELVLAKTEVADTTQEIMNINFSEAHDNPVDCLDINAETSYDVQNKFKRLFIENYVKPQRPKEPKVQAELKLTLKDFQPFHCTPRRISYSERDQLQCIFDRLLEKNYIRPSNSEYASPIVLTRKKNEEVRMIRGFQNLK